MEGIDSSEDALKIVGIVGFCGRFLVDGIFGSVHVQRKVDAGCCKCIHTRIMVQAVVDCVDPDSIDL